MEFDKTLKTFINRIEALKDSVSNEEATKMSLIIPFFQLVGYDVFNPLEFCPEFTADVGIKKGEKVDYAILIDGNPIILIEAKAANKKLDKYSSQLFRYYATSNAKFAILTNGINYRFYTDFEDTNKMDKDPFLDINLLDLKDNHIQQLAKFHRDVINVNAIAESASLLKYNSIFKGSIEQQFISPTDDFVKLFIQPVYKGTKTQSVIERFRPILKKALDDFLAENVSEKLQFTLDTKATINSSTETETTSSTDEWDAFSLIKRTLKDTLDINKISVKKNESYIAVLYENNSRKWICRLVLSSIHKVLILPDENKKEIKYPITKIADIGKYSEELCEIGKRYLAPAQSTLKPYTGPILHTKWGAYEMPSPYRLDLTRGPRNDLRPI